MRKVACVFCLDIGVHYTTIFLIFFLCAFAALRLRVTLFLLLLAKALKPALKRR